MKKVIALFLATALFATPVFAAYENYVELAISDGVITGDENGNVNPDNPVTRAEFAVILTRFLNISGGINTFQDVSPRDWFYDAMVAANHYSILFGDENGNANPYAFISRQDAVTILGRFYQAKSPNSALAQDVPQYAKEYWAYAVTNGLLTKTDPMGYVSKGEMLQLLYDYDIKDSGSMRFMGGYPRVSQDAGTFSHITVEVRTNKPCKIYYALAEENSPHKEIDTLFAEADRNKATVSIKANINMRYDLYLLAVDSDGVTSKISVIKGITPFLIASGDGTKTAPYIIYTEDQLAQISMLPDKYYKLGSDIVLTKEWTPLSNFTGVLDGNGHAIYGLSVSGKNNAGLFALSEGTIRNLTVYGDVTAVKNAGIIAGENDGVIENCVAGGTVSANTDYAGGICGTNHDTVKNCLTVTESVTAGSFAGGISGANNGTIESCLSATNTVISEMYAGGISGTNDGAIRQSVSACMTVHDVITQTSGRITTNKNSGVLYKNYFYVEAYSDSPYVEPADDSPNGYDIGWSDMRQLSFYRKLGWDTSLWKLGSNGFRLIHPKSAQAPKLTAGSTIYFPKSVRTSQDLRDIDLDESGHYILENDIHLPAPWKTICSSNGFSGTFDGNGHTIYNLNLNTQPGLFSNITGGTVKNLTLRNVTSQTDTLGGILTACNYGYIDNCKVYGEIITKKSTHTGSFAGLNHGAISNCEAYVDITNSASNSTTGGICAENDGVIFGAYYRGTITANGENAVIGGICGYDTGGYLSDSFANVTASTEASFSYIGGVCGMAEGSQIYKCASDGSIAASSKNTVYSGGICALLQNATLYNCYSVADVRAFSNIGYVGGICGLSSGSYIQNTYSAGNILSGNSLMTGGICGYSENGFIMQNISLNPAINGGENCGAIYGDTDMTDAYDNYSCDKTLINSQHFVTGEKNGVITSLDILKNTDFYFKPLFAGGQLGWPTNAMGDDIWTNGESGYSFPVLSGVNGQNLLSTPSYKK